tara:strand:- start:1599 stop:2195 length:597 start_codon:yes stop_codon:yes gene_type:complete
MNLPNALTIFRVILTPIFIYLLFNSSMYSNLSALIIFILASVTDAFDGYYARKYNIETEFGNFLDPLADKILVSSAFISFYLLDLIKLWMVVVILSRDFFITCLRIVMKKNGQSLKTSRIAKSKTAVQLILIIFILIFLAVEKMEASMFSLFGNIILEYNIVYNATFIVSIFTFYTGFRYFQNNYDIIKKIVVNENSN